MVMRPPSSKPKRPAPKPKSQFPVPATPTKARAQVMRRSGRKK